MNVVTDSPLSKHITMSDKKRGTQHEWFDKTVKMQIL